MISACQSDTVETETVCTTSLEPGIIIEIVDKASNDPISCGASVILQDSSYDEVLTHPQDSACSDDMNLSGAYERSGFYNVTVSKEGYEDWYAYDVEIESGTCHVKTISLKASMERK